jgi:hypothetical protein
MGKRLLAGVASLVLVTGAACGGDDDEDAPRKEGLAPQFMPEASSPGASTATDGGARSSGASGGTNATSGATTATVTGGGGTVEGSTTTVPGGGAATAGPSPVVPTEAALTDPAGDVTASPLDRPPAWADLVGARLVRSASGFELRVRLKGGAAPAKTADGEHTMNIASFYDLDGDGRIDTEVWLNVASGGWGATWFDNVGDGGGFQESSGVQVAPEGDEVVARFPLTHLRGAERFRWAIASEWGRYETIGTVAAARDDVPDNDNVAAFPGR